MELQGRVIALLPTQSGQGRNGEWVKNSFVIEWEENGYKQKLCLEVVGADKFEKMKNAVRVGNDVLVRFSVSSREWQNRWFTSCQCFYCSTIGGSQQNTSTNTQQQQQAPQPQNTQQAQQQADDGLPF